MGCRAPCTADKLFIYINIAFAMYSGALLSTAARLAWDPSTYTWFRFLCAAQYRASAVFVLCAGALTAGLAALAAADLPLQRRPHRRRTTMNIYCGGVALLALGEVSFGAWLAASLAAWWREAPEAELARRGVDLLADIKPALLAMERYKDVAQPIYHMIEEVEREAPNNVFVIMVFALAGALLQIAAFIVARRLARRATATEEETEKEKQACEEDSDSAECSAPPPGWRKNANLRMYTILDKIF